MVSVPTSRVILPERRIEQRRFPCRIHARIALSEGETYCIVENVSLGGLGLQTDAVVRLRPDQRAIVSAAEIGTLSSVVRWVAGNHAGLMFKPMGNNFDVLRKLIEGLNEASPEF